MHGQRTDVQPTTDAINVIKIDVDAITTCWWPTNDTRVMGEDDSSATIGIPSTNGPTERTTRTTIGGCSGINWTTSVST